MARVYHGAVPAPQAGTCSVQARKDQNSTVSPALIVRPAPMVL